MSNATRTYYLMNTFVLCIISIHEYLKSYGKTVSQERRDWESEANELAVLVSDEKSIASNNDVTMTREVGLDIAGFCDKLTFRWADRLQDQSHNLHTTYPETDEASILRYLYEYWFHQCILRYRDLMEEEPLKSSNYYGRYQENKVQFDSLVKLLNATHNEAKGIRNVLSDEQFSRFKNDVEAYAKQLADEWKQVVIAKSADLNYQLPD